MPPKRGTPEWLAIAVTRFDDGFALLDCAEKGTMKQAHSLSGACYIAGYGIEAALKAALCKVIPTDDYEMLHMIPGNVIDGRCIFKVHRFWDLITLLEERVAAHKELQDLVKIFKAKFPIYHDVRNWDANRRYDTQWLNQPDKAWKFMNAVDELVRHVEEVL